MMERAGSAPHEVHPQLVAQIAGRIFANNPVEMYRAVYEARLLVDMSFQTPQAELQQKIEEAFQARAAEMHRDLQSLASGLLGDLQ